MSRLDPLDVREWLAAFRGGMMFYLGCHLVDLVMQIQGVPERVTAFNTATGQADVNTEDFGFAVLQYPNATSVIRTAATEVGGMRRRQLVICGEKGSGGAPCGNVEEVGLLLSVFLRLESAVDRDAEGNYGNTVRGLLKLRVGCETTAENDLVEVEISHDKVSLTEITLR